MPYMLRTFIFYILTLIALSTLMAMFVTGWNGVGNAFRDQLPDLLSLGVPALIAAVIGAVYEIKVRSWDEVDDENGRYGSVLLINLAIYASVGAFLFSDRVSISTLTLLIGLGLAYLQMKLGGPYKWYLLWYRYFTCLFVFLSSVMGYQLLDSFMDSESKSIEFLPNFLIPHLLVCITTFLLFRLGLSKRKTW